MTSDTAYRIKYRALEAASKVSHHVSQNGASDQPYVTDVEFKAENRTDGSGIMATPTFTTGIEFKILALDGRVQNVRIEGPSWTSGDYFLGVGAITLNDIDESKMMEWAEEIKRVAPIFRTLVETDGIFHQGVLPWTNYGEQSNLLVIFWSDEKEETDGIPWDDVLPRGIIHIVGPYKKSYPETLSADTPLSNVGTALKGVLNRDQAVVWVQFNGDYTRDSLAHELALDPINKKLHFVTAQSIYEFVSHWNTLNRAFAPELWVLYDPWTAPDIPPDRYGSNVHPDHWMGTLENLLIKGTLIAVNRVDPDLTWGASHELYPWRLAEHEQHFMDSLWAMDFKVGVWEHRVYIPVEHKYNRDVIAESIKKDGLEVGLPNDGNIEVWKPRTVSSEYIDGTPSVYVIDMKAWRDRNGD